MEYLQIKNNGEIDPLALILYGGSTKRNDKESIGEFGTGNKNATAVLLREGYDIKIFSGMKEVKLTLKELKFRDQVFHHIFIDGEKTYLTTEAAYKWGVWEAFREFYSNAIDEGGCELNIVSDIAPEEGKTHFYIEFKDNLQDVYLNFDDYFAFKKNVLSENTSGKIYAKHSGNNIFYRRGIRVHTLNTNTIFDYDLNDIELTEDRTVKYVFEIKKHMFRLILSSDNPRVFRKFINSIGPRSTFYEKNFDSWGIYSKDLSNAFKEYIMTLNLYPNEYLEFLGDNEKNGITFIPLEFYNWLIQYVPDINTPLTTLSDKYVFKEMDINQTQRNILNKAIAFAVKGGFDVNQYKIKTVDFNKNSRYGGADRRNKIIFIARNKIDKGIHETANTLIHEYVHLFYNVDDGTQAMDQVLIDIIINKTKDILGEDF